MADHSHRAVPNHDALMPQFGEDLAALPQDVQVQAMTVLLLIQHGQQAGLPLHDLASTGDLTGCYKFYFDVDPDIKPRYRLVYRYHPDDQTLLAVAVGRRENLDAYHRAARNLLVHGIPPARP